MVKSHLLIVLHAGAEYETKAVQACHVSTGSSSK